MGEKKNRVTSPADGEAFVTKDGRDIYAAAYLDRETYEEEYFLTVETCTGYIEKNPFVKRIAPHLSVEE